MSNYNLTKWPILAGEHLPFCTRCGSLISDSAVTAHDRFHARHDPGDTGASDVDDWDPDSPKGSLCPP
jgi:hypothetical protein